MRTRVEAKQVVITVLRELAREKFAHNANPVIVFYKSEFIRKYNELKKRGKVKSIKIETLLRALRELAAKSSFLSYYMGKRRGVYILDYVELDSLGKILQ